MVGTQRAGDAMTVTYPESYLPCGCIFHDHGPIWHQCDVAVDIRRRALEAEARGDLGLYLALAADYADHMDGRARMEAAR
jgi:hypothetical protein